jgi:hypothetical protein
MFAEQSIILLYDAKSEDLTNQITDNSEDLRLLQKYASNEIGEIHAKYAPEKERIRDEIESLDKAENRDEYEDLINELKDVRDEEDAEIEAVETRIHDKEEEVTVENDLLQTQLEEVNAQTEVFEQMLSDSIKKNFGYFQN